MTTDDAPAAGDVAGDLAALARDEQLPPERRAAAMFHAFDVDRRVVEAATSLTAAELRLLWLLSDGRPRTQRDIATELNLEQSTVNRQVNAALRAGHLDRDGAEAGPAMLSATASGRQRYEGDVEALLDIMGTALSALGPDQQQFLESLATFVVAYREALATARPPR